VPLPFTDLLGSLWRLMDQVEEVVYERDDRDLLSRGLYPDTPAWKTSVLRSTENPRFTRPNRV
jgi:hypothetical protein